METGIVTTEETTTNGVRFCFLCGIQVVVEREADFSSTSFILYNILNLDVSWEKFQSISYCRLCLADIVKVQTLLEELENLENEITQQKYSIEKRLKDAVGKCQVLQSNEMTVVLREEVVNKLKSRTILSMMEKVNSKLTQKKKIALGSARVLKEVSIPNLNHITQPEKPHTSSFVPQNFQHQYEMPLELSNPGPSQQLYQSQNSEYFTDQNITPDTYEDSGTGQVDASQSYKSTQQRASNLRERQRTANCIKSFRKRHPQGPRQTRGSRPFPCMLCPASFIRRNHFEMHQRVHTGEKPYQCEVCQARFTQISSLRRHFTVSHNKPQETMQTEDVNSILPDTPSTSQVYSSHCLQSQENILPDYEIQSSHNPHLEMNSVIEGVLKMETESTLPLETSTADGNAIFACDICGEGFTRYDMLMEHDKFHKSSLLPNNTDSNIGQNEYLESNKQVSSQLSDQSKSPHSCYKCDKNFRSARALLLHSTECKNQLSCPVCKRSNFKRPFDLRRHMDTHSDHRNFKCDLCPKAFMTASNLAGHVRDIHSGERPYHCTVCSMKFKRLNALKVHERIHTGDKPFKCDICNERFFRKARMLSHMEIHRVDTRYICN